MHSGLNPSCLLLRFYLPHQRQRAHTYGHPSMRSEPWSLQQLASGHHLRPRVCTPAGNSALRWIDLRKGQQGPWKWLELFEVRECILGTINPNLGERSSDGLFSLALQTLHPTGRGTVKRGCQAGQPGYPGLREALLWSTMSTGGDT